LVSQRGPAKVYFASAAKTLWCSRIASSSASGKDIPFSGVGINRADGAWATPVVRFTGLFATEISVAKPRANPVLFGSSLRFRAIALASAASCLPPIWPRPGHLAREPADYTSTQENIMTQPAEIPVAYADFRARAIRGARGILDALGFDLAATEGVTEQAALAVAIWSDSDEADGYGMLVIKGADILRAVAEGERGVDVQWTAIPVRGWQVAEALRRALAEAELPVPLVH